MAYSEQTTTTSTAVAYLQDFRSEPCQVCGENASGWHCGSITCEACKKFFLRSVNGEHVKYRCIRDKKCPITRTTRTQCQFCRYSKCIAIGMTLTEEHSNPKIEDIFRGIPCAVCTDASSGLHFGVTTCESCKGFFRRMIKERIPQHYKCLERNNCEVNTSTRNLCRACRFQKCLSVGMSIEGSRIGRQSNLFKHKMVEMQRHGLIQSQLFHVLTSNLNNPKKKTTHSREISSACVQQSPSLHGETSLPPELLRQIYEMEMSYRNYLKDLPSWSFDTNDLWAACISQFNHYSICVRNFVDGIPNFNSLNVEDKTSLVYQSIHSVMLMCFCIQSVRSETSNSTWNYLNLSSNSPFYQYIQQQFPFFFELFSSTRAFENDLQRLDLDDKEIALILTLLITSIGDYKSTPIEHLEEEFFSILLDYMTAHRGINSKDYFILTIRIPFVHRLNKLISTYITNLKCSLSHSM
ncbi:unnamed protein product [Adineta ricciae]|uniref:Uncharacterized protein n=1 Tax=Adineta ricciae TaxID=249248 RepID=A0A815WFV3_ADIRI|nr:unnamed protein product [Adineta ricciae]